MIDSFPFRSWEEVTDAFWPFGPGAETVTLTVIGMIVTVLAIIGWIYMDNRMLTEHAERLRTAGFGRQPPPGGTSSRPGS
jgi:hypothetical protein